MTARMDTSNAKTAYVSTIAANKIALPDSPGRLATRWIPATEARA